MPLIQAKCTNCGGVLQVDNTLEAAICPFCKTPYVVEKAINNYNISNQYSINNSEVHIHGNELSDDEKYENANSFLSIHKDYARAEELFNELVAKKPNDYRGWWGLVRVKTNEFTGYSVSKHEMRKLAEFVDSSYKVCDDETVKKDIEHSWNCYLDKYDSLQRLYDKRKDSMKDIKKQRLSAEHSWEEKVLGLSIIVLIVLVIVISILNNVNNAIVYIVSGTLLLACGVFLIIKYKASSHAKGKTDAITKELNQIENEMVKIDPFRTFYRWYE